MTTLETDQSESLSTDEQHFTLLCSKTGSMLHRNLKKRKEKHQTVIGSKTHSTTIMEMINYHNKLDTFGNSTHTYKDLT